MLADIAVCGVDVSEMVTFLYVEVDVSEMLTLLYVELMLVKW